MIFKMEFHSGMTKTVGTSVSVGNCSLVLCSSVSCNSGNIFLFSANCTTHYQYKEKDSSAVTSSLM